MKAKVYILATLLCGVSLFSSCDKNDGYLPANEVVQAFHAKYPEATRTSWENKAGYAKAEFRTGNYDAEAWFDYSGNWVMTETDIPYRALPQAVKDSFEASSYATWKVDDVDKIERRDAGTIYIIEVENGNAEFELHYSEDGVLIKEIADDDNDEHIPSIVPDAIKNLVHELYPGSTILEIDSEHGMTEVDILHENRHKELLVDANNQWIQTEWEIRRSEVPAVVMNALDSSAYASYIIDDINIIHKPDGLYYEFELEKGNREIKVVFKEDGTVNKNVMNI